MERLRSGSIQGVIDLTPAYATVLVSLGPNVHEPERVRAAVLASLVGVGGAVQEGTPRVVDVPVCYEHGFAPDAEAVARLCGLEQDEVVRRHTGAVYIVEFIGFTPGFPYLSGLPAALHVPRLDRPRARVPAGSIAIAGEQAGIYPRATPGGWRLIGRTPLSLFEPARESPALLKPGDRVRFIPIDAAGFAAIAAQGRC